MRSGPGWVEVDNPFAHIYEETMDGGWAFIEQMEGPWRDEPHAARVMAGDVPALVVRNRFGVWCGYVGLPLDHRHHGMDYDHIDVEVHGGLNFASDDRTLDEMAGIRPNPQPGMWWVGFDCGHAGDHTPSLDYMLAKLGHPHLPGLGWPEVYRTIDYAVAETLHLARQLA